ncbi:hypothetical protein [Ralstonia pseudosolanacearum]|uniref:hypothetical protein n=1 Tax=Ralstonia pseudosolanacearum TaxID=1310165 RepID=UPI002676B18E|nr:hypothetical protein [Ralstonia pseudosolanacearum]MDO3524501.1 hypothetical protein [Ralstonia pseudosolanacearum]MDO3552401.1 hypothetical protein [Ralstonia pseudosolanacearum]MDO3591222.1 hypothetical protein [Ralstonia pseudosolanacearum]MDO3595712.1 hypothetical protein [Ralstonia pseudosolanacearum]MDO3601281.1 hypothetical protein [Ralstonia pseudosolanacearum]
MAIINLASDVVIGNVDQILTVLTTKKRVIGKLKFSKGSVEWWPKGASVNAHTFGWEEFAKILENHSPPGPVRSPRRRLATAAKKSANATSAGAKGTAKPTVKRNGRTKPDTKA